nr:hypothetical protein [Desulfurococcales archaeon]
AHGYHSGGGWHPEAPMGRQGAPGTMGDWDHDDQDHDDHEGTCHAGMGGGPGYEGASEWRHGPRGWAGSGAGWRQGGPGCWRGGLEEWNGTATVVWADPSLRLVGLQLEDGENVTARLARVYVRASDGGLVYGPWLAGALEGETLWVHLVGHDGRWMLVEASTSGDSYIIPHAFASSS